MRERQITIKIAKADQDIIIEGQRGAVLRIIVVGILIGQVHKDLDKIAGIDHFSAEYRIRGKKLFFGTAKFIDHLIKGTIYGIRGICIKDQGIVEQILYGGALVLC